MAPQEQASRAIVIEAGLRPEHRALAAEGYWQAFARKLRYPLGPKHKAIAFFDRVIQPDHAISALSPNGDFLGAAGFKSPAGSFIGGSFRDLAAVYGTFGAAWRGALVSCLERDCEAGTLLMDGIFVAPEARGYGVGTALLHAILRHAEATGLTRVRLDVIDTNPRARALYEREGFIAQREQALGLLAPVFGFSSATEMVRALPR
jgi:ribosomal protein S18 acetylase RimI-like enzyme